MAQNNIFPYTDENILQSEEFKLKLSNGIGGDWRNLGNILNIKDNYLDTIDQNDNKTDEKAYSMLTKWVQINDNPTLMELKKGLFSIERVDLIGFVYEFINSFSAAENACLKTPQLESYKKSYKHSYSEDDIENSNSFQYNKNTEKIVLIENSGGIKQILKSLHLNKIRKKFSYKTGLKKSTSVDNIVTGDIKTAKSMLTHKTGGSKKSSIYIRPSFRKKFEDQGILKEQVQKKTNKNQEEPLPESIIKKSVVIDKNKIIKRSKSFNVFEDLESKSAYQMFFDRSISNLESSEKELLYSYDSFSVLSRVSVELKKHYQNCYGKINEFQPLSEAPKNADLIHKFVDLCIVDSVNAQIDNVFSVERMEFLAKQLRYTPLPYSEIFMKENSVILITGIAGIGKTWFLRKCLLDWSNNLIWKNFELVFYLECWRLNQYQNISNINELLNVFYKDVLNDFNVNNHTALFIIDGLDEFKFLNELLHSSVISNYPIVNALADVGKYKHMVAGRVYAIDQYQSLFAEHSDKLLIQIMGFNENGINNYVENNVKAEKKEIAKATVKESPIAKAMASVPFYLSYMCKIISESNKIYSNSFKTMTDLYANIFLYVLDHLSKRDDYKDLFIECFYESQSLLTDQIKPIVDKIKWWGISIKDGKTSYETSCENYFVNHYITSGRKLAWLEVDKNSLSDEEKNLCIQCSRNVCNVNFHHLINFEGWKPKDNIEWLFMHISNCIITKNDFETNFFPWINLCEGLELYLHDDIDFVDDIFKWIRSSNIKELLIEYRGKYFVTSMN